MDLEAFYLFFGNLPIQCSFLLGFGTRYAGVSDQRELDGKERSHWKRQKVLDFFFFFLFERVFIISLIK
jgi:hypothetical protein